MKRLVKSCKDLIGKRKICRTSNPERKKQQAFHTGLYDLFEVTQNLTNEENGNEPDEGSSTFSSHESNTPSDSSISNEENSNQPDDASDTLSSHESNTLNDSNNVCDDDSDHNDRDHDSDPDYDPSEDANDCSPQKKIPIPDDLLNKVSVIKGSYRLSEHLLNVGLQIGGADPSAFGISKSNLWSRITNLRSKQKHERIALLAADPSKIVIHFDGKSCTRLNERHIATEERLIILCRTDKDEIPLGFPVVESKSGLHCGTEVLRTLDENHLSNRLIGMVCDTERTNTGRINGACAIIEKTLEKEFLNLRCRHHIKEVMLKDVFTLQFGMSQSAKITTFDILKENWNIIKQNHFSYASINEEDLPQAPLFKQLFEEAMESISRHASSEIIRNDYAELNDLVLKFFGVQTNKTFKVPGATSNARWMARAIYALKTYLFREHLDLDFDFIISLEQFCIFVAVIYTKHWNRCTNAVDAAYNDLKLLKELEAYKEINYEIANVALQAHERHLWYLSDELVVLSLFSDKVSNEEKLMMRQMMTRAISNRTENSIIHTTTIDIQNAELHNFISPRSFFLFDLMNLADDFFDEDPGDWNELESFKKAKQSVIDLIIVVNDSAERALQFGANLISNQRVQSESRLQDLIVSLCK